MTALEMAKGVLKGRCLSAMEGARCRTNGDGVLLIYLEKALSVTCQQPLFNPNHIKPRAIDRPRDVPPPVRFWFRIWLWGRIQPAASATCATPFLLKCPIRIRGPCCAKCLSEHLNVSKRLYFGLRWYVAYCTPRGENQGPRSVYPRCRGSHESERRRRSRLE